MGRKTVGLLGEVKSPNGRQLRPKGETGAGFGEVASASHQQGAWRRCRLPQLDSGWSPDSPITLFSALRIMDSSC